MKKSKVLSLYVLVLLCSSMNGARKFLQNLFSSVRFRSPPPIFSIITDNHKVSESNASIRVSSFNCWLSVFMAFVLIDLVS
jgi:hypothetical protein